MIRRAVALSLLLHGTTLLCLILMRQVVPPPEESEPAAYSVVMATPAPAQMPAVQAPAEPASQPSSPPDNVPPQPNQPQETSPAEPLVTPPETVPEPPPVPLSEPSPQPSRSPEPEPKSRPPIPTAVQPPAQTSPRRAQTTRTPNPTTPPGSPAGEPKPLADSKESVARPPPAETAPPNLAWLARVNQWLLAHRVYPERARLLGRQGTVVVRFEVNRQGQVLNASMVQGSGSDVLDQAALTLVRNASLPPFPPDMLALQQTITVPVHYQLD